MSAPDAPPRGGRNSLRPRWLVLAVFPAGYAWTYPLLAFHWLEYAFWTVVAMFCCAALLLRLRTFAVSTWPGWILLGTFLLGYYVKFYVLVRAAAAPALPLFFVVPEGRLERFADPWVALQTFRLATVGFAVFCLAFVLLIRTLGEDRGAWRDLQNREVRYVVRVALIAGVAIFLVTTAVAAALNVLVAGAADDQYGFRILGWLFYSRSVLLVVLSLLLVQCGLVTDTRAWTAWGIALLFALVVSDVLIRSTRGGLFTAAVALFFMFLVVRQRLEARAVRLMAAAAAVALLLFPVITQYRSLRILDEAASVEVFARAVGLTLAQASWSELTLAGAAAMLLRFIGIDSVVFLVDPSTWLGVARVAELRADGEAVSDHFTHAVVGVPLEAIHAESPSLLGWFLMVGGPLGATLGFAAYLAVGWGVWTWILRSDWLIKPVALVQFLVLWLSLASEGTLDTRGLQVAALVASLIACEAFLRYERRRAHRVPHRGRPALAAANSLDASTSAPRGQA